MCARVCVYANNTECTLYITKAEKMIKTSSYLYSACDKWHTAASGFFVHSNLLLGFLHCARFERKERYRSAHQFMSIFENTKETNFSLHLLCRFAIILSLRINIQLRRCEFSVEVPLIEQKKIIMFTALSLLLLVIWRICVFLCSIRLHSISFVSLLFSRKSNINSNLNIWYMRVCECLPP